MLERKARAIAARPLTSGQQVAPLGVSLGGDLPPPWRAGKYVVLPDHAARLPELAIGQSGSGKSTYIGRRVYLAAGAGRQLVVLDGKGDRGFVDLVTDAYLAANSDATIHVFPDAPSNGWPGDPAAQVNRLLGTWQWTLESDWDKQQATLALRLACSAPGDPVDSMRELVRRMDPPTLARLWAKHPAEAALVKMLTPDLPSICIRLANLAAAVAGRMDGTAAIGEADLTIISLPMMAHREDGESVFRILMADVGHWVSVRKTARPALLVVDEFSAVSGARAGAIDVMERGRSFGVPSILSGQSYASLGRRRRPTASSRPRTAWSCSPATRLRTWPASPGRCRPPRPSTRSRMAAGTDGPASPAAPAIASTPTRCASSSPVNVSWSVVAAPKSSR
jgi:hypothetical protein